MKTHLTYTLTHATTTTTIRQQEICNDLRTVARRARARTMWHQLVACCIQYSSIEFQHQGMPLTYKYPHIQVSATKETNINEMPLRGLKRGAAESALDAVIHARADDYCRRQLIADSDATPRQQWPTGCRATEPLAAGYCRLAACRSSQCGSRMPTLR